MLQITQYQKTGELSIDELPAPPLKEGGILVRNYYSVISAGTERTSVETAQASMVGKAKSRPDLVKQVMENVKREGFSATYKKVQTRMDNFKELGYSSAGVVIETNVEEFKVGDRVACAGGGFASHAEIVSIPKNLACKIPDDVELNEAAFTTIGAIAMQGVRQADLRVGEFAAVIGLGLIGLITVQILKASGCRVIGIDINDSNFELAKKIGCNDCLISNGETEKNVESFTNGYGIDSVLLTAGTSSNQPIELALAISRKKGKVVVVGAVGMNIPRPNFFQKEIDLRISCSYGPGRYDYNYEEKGNDYPVGYVRWTENRNMQSVLELVSQKKLDINSIISHTFPVDKGVDAYDLITGKVKEKYLGVVIDYSFLAEKNVELRKKIILESKNIQPSAKLGIGFIGAGNFAQSYLLPNVKKLDADLIGVATADPVNSKSVANKFGFLFCATDPSEVISSKDINTIFIATRHDSHAEYIVKGLNSGKNVYVEKPLAISPEQLNEIKEAYSKNSSHLMLGFNRRFSKPIRTIKEFFENNSEPYVFTYRVNAGFIPLDHWVQDSAQMGRIIGEVCHFIDVMQYLSEASPVSVFARSIHSSNIKIKDDDNVSITLEFEDGSIGTILYLANGDSSLPKEYLEVSSAQKSAVMNNFKEVILYKNGKRTIKKFDGSKGHVEEVKHFLDLVKGECKTELSFESLCVTTQATFEILESLRTSQPQLIK